jgi:hypothetical protein
MLTRLRPILAAALVTVPLAAAPAAGDTVVTLRNHADEMKIMGQTTPAQDDRHHYWFGADATRHDMGESSVIADLGAKKMHIVNHADKTYSTIDLPFRFESLVGPEMAPMMGQMMQMMAPKVSVTKSDRTGSFAGYSCKYAQLTMSMAMMQMTTDMCLSGDLPIDYARYAKLLELRGELAMNAAWLKEMAEKLDGFPVRSDTTMTMMGSTFKSWQELESVEQKSPPAGHYAPPAEYEEIKYDPMAQQQQQPQRRRRR